MSNIQFTPEAWERSGDALAQDASSFGARAAQTIGAMNVETLGATHPQATIADTAMAMIFPVAFQAMTETAAKFTQGLEGTGAAMRDTGATYRATESELAAQPASFSGDANSVGGF